MLVRICRAEERQSVVAVAFVVGVVAVIDFDVVDVVVFVVFVVVSGVVVAEQKRIWYT